jgi:hypothetical protein
VNSCNQWYKGPINSIIESKTRLISHANPRIRDNTLNVGTHILHNETFVIDLQRKSSHNQHISDELVNDNNIRIQRIQRIVFVDSKV